jgi:hypothetical protein
MEGGMRESARIFWRETPKVTAYPAIRPLSDYIWKKIGTAARKEKRDLRKKSFLKLLSGYRSIQI